MGEIDMKNKEYEPTFDRKDVLRLVLLAVAFFAIAALIVFGMAYFHEPNPARP